MGGGAATPLGCTTLNLAAGKRLKGRGSDPGRAGDCSGCSQSSTEGEKGCSWFGVLAIHVPPALSCFPLLVLRSLEPSVRGGDLQPAHCVIWTKGAALLGTHWH